MSDSLRDQLLQLGFKAPPKPAPKPAAHAPGKPAAKPHRHAGAKPGGKPADERTHGPRPHGARPHDRRPQDARRKPAEQIDLGKAYALRAQKEKEERIAAEQAKQEQARVRREARAKLSAFLQGKALNDPNAEIARHFDYGGKIKRVYVNEAQLKALNAGELGVVQQEGRYLLVDAATLAEAEAIFAAAIALKVDPNAPASEDPYADPKYQVPDDLVW